MKRKKEDSSKLLEKNREKLSIAIGLWLIVNGFAFFPIKFSGFRDLSEIALSIMIAYTLIMTGNLYNFVLVEGAYYLMSINAFTSFKQEVVIEGLKKHIGGFDDALDLSLKIMKDPLGTAFDQKSYLSRIEPFTEFIFSSIENL